MQKMGKKGKRSNANQSDQPPLATSSSTSLPFSRAGKNKVTPAKSTSESEIPTPDALPYPDDKADHYINAKGEIPMTSDQKICEGLGEQDESLEESELEKASKRRQKKERQKEKKLARRMAAQRRDSELSIEFLEDDQEVARSRSQSSDSPKSVKISLCRHPITTLEYFLKEIPCLLCDFWKRFIATRRQRSNDWISLAEIVLTVAATAAVLSLTYLWIASNDPYSIQVKQYISWHLYWIFLGILSSVGLGTGLHTFILYLGPFIAKVSLAAEECSTLNFPQPPYPNQVTCPLDIPEGHREIPSIWEIASKVRWETLAWGFGTALGELPPYFVARAASFSDESNPENLENQQGCFAKVQLTMRNFVLKVGFLGILLCASIPNPLFDLAGITCGHFQIPFWIFFGATAIGKTIIKSQLQMIFVILAFNESSRQRALEAVGSIPKIGIPMRTAFSDFVDYQRAALHNQDTSRSGGILKIVTEIIVLVMITYFVGSIINGMARSYAKRIIPTDKKRDKKSSTPRKRLKLSN